MEGLWSVYGELELPSYGLNEESMVFYLCVGYSTALVLGPLLEKEAGKLRHFIDQPAYVDLHWLMFVPAIGVCRKRGCCTVEFLICLVLTILGYIPGINYALYVIVFQNREGSHELGAPLNSA